MKRSFVTPLGIRHTVRLTQPAEFEAAIERLGGLDLAVLGLGPNGHLGFNEPPSFPDAPTRTLDLTPASLESNAAYWDGLPVPSGAITAGMNVILAARADAAAGQRRPQARYVCAARWKARRRPKCPLPS